MADINTQAITQAFAAVEAHLGSMSAAVKDTIDAMKQRGDAEEEQLKKTIKGDDEIAQKRRATLMSLINAEREFRKKKKETDSKFIDDARKFLELQKETAARKQRWDDAQLAGVSKATFLHQQQLWNAHRKELADRHAMLRQNRKLSAEYQQAGDKMHQEWESAERKLGGFWSMAGERMAKQIGGAITSKLNTFFSGAAFLSGMKEAFGIVKEEISSGMSATTEQLMTLGYQLGLTGQEYAKLSKAHRDVVLAAGGTTKHLELLTAANKQYEDLIGDNAERTQFVAEQMKMLAERGIKPTAKNMELLAPEFAKLQKTSNMTSAEFNSAMADITDDAATSAQLRAASSEEERAAIMKGIAGRLAENRAMGMTTKQAIEATKALNKLSGQGPLERFKQAAKLRAMGGAMGVAGGDEASRILIKGQRASADEKQELQKYLSNLSNTMSESQMGSIGGEIFAATLADKLGLQELIGPTSPFNTRLVEGTKYEQDSLKLLGENNKDLKKIVIFFDRVIDALTKNPLLMIITGAIGGIFGILKGKAFASLLGGAAKSLAGGAGGLLRGAAAMGGGALAAKGALVAGAAGAAGAAAYFGTRALLENTEAGNKFEVGLGGLVDKIMGKASMNDAIMAAKSRADFEKISKEYGVSMESLGFKPGGPTVAPGVQAQAQTTGAAAPVGTVEERKEKEAKEEERKKKIDETQKATATTIETQLVQMKENSMTLTQLLEAMKESNELSKEMLTALAMTDEKERKAMNVGERLSNIKNLTKQYKNLGTNTA